MVTIPSSDNFDDLERAHRDAVIAARSFSPSINVDGMLSSVRDRRRTAEVKDAVPAHAGRDLDRILDSARAGDESGMAELWHALNPPVLRYLRVVVGQAAEDVASETWLQAARDIRRFRGDAAGFRVWLFRVARNRALEELRRSGRRKEDPAGLYTAPDLPSQDDPAREAVERLATRQALRLIAELPANQAEAVMLRVVVGLDVTQTAAVLGKRPGAIRLAAMRGLRRLAAVIDGEGLLETEHAGAARAVRESWQVAE